VHLLNTSDLLSRSVITTWGHGTDPQHFSYPCGVAIDSTNFLYVADSYNDRIHVFDLSNGHYSRSLVEPGSEPGQLSLTVSVAVTDQEIYSIEVGDNRISVFNRYNGHYVRHLGCQPGASDADSGRQPITKDNHFEFGFPSGISPSQSCNGPIYVSDTGNRAVKAMDRNDGAVITKIGFGEIRSPSGIAVHDDRYIYISDYTDHRISMYDVNGEIVQMIGSGKGSGVEEFDAPCGIALLEGNDGDQLVVADSMNHRLQIFH